MVLLMVYMTEEEKPGLHNESSSIQVHLNHVEIRHLKVIICTDAQQIHTLMYSKYNHFTLSMSLYFTLLPGPDVLHRSVGLVGDACDLSDSLFGEL